MIQKNLRRSDMSWTSCGLVRVKSQNLNAFAHFEVACVGASQNDHHLIIMSVRIASEQTTTYTDGVLVNEGDRIVRIHDVVGRGIHGD
jgi:hypothetical protein